MRKYFMVAVVAANQPCVDMDGFGCAHFIGSMNTRSARSRFHPTDNPRQHHPIGNKFYPSIPNGSDGTFVAR